jgi:carbamoyltransferase
MTKNILGLSAFYHDSAAALVQGGRIIAAAQEERFTRKRHDPRFPKNAINYCLEEAGIEADELDAVVAAIKETGASATCSSSSMKRIVSW